MGIAVSRGKAILVEEIRVFQASYLGDFRVAFPLCFKASPSAKPFIWKVVKIHLNQNLRANKTHFHMKGIRTRTCFGTEANCNSEIAS